MKKNKLISFLIICMFSVIFVGCKKEEEAVVTVEVEEEEVNMFGLTDSKQKMYAEYAAGVLMKYNAGSNMRILEGRKLEKETIEEDAKREQEEKRQQAAEEYAANKGKSDKEQEIADSEQSSYQDNQGSSVSYIQDMSEATGNSDFSIYYTGCEVTSSYPDSGEDIMLAVEASPGKMLLVTKFSVVNNSTETQNFDMFSIQPQFVLELNGARYKAQYTLLLDDLFMYKGDIAAGDFVDTVLVFEVPEAEASSINDMEISITVGDSVSLMELNGSVSSWIEETEEADGETEGIEDTAADGEAEGTEDMTETDVSLETEEEETEAEEAAE